MNYSNRRLTTGLESGMLVNSSKEFILYDSPSANKINGLVKSHRVINPVRIMTSGCNTAVENLPIFVEKALFKVV